MPRGKFKRSKEHLAALLEGRKKAGEDRAIYVKCPMCGKESRRTPSVSRVLFCSIECKEKNWIKNVRPNIKPHLWTEEEKKSIRDRKIVQCRKCKLNFEVKIGSKQKFCSRKCFYENGRPEISGSNHHNYKHGLSGTKEYRSHIQRIREFRKKGSGGSHTLQEWNNLKIKYCHSCAICGRKEPVIKLTRDHITPVSKGGSSDISNIQPLCVVCNSKKNNK